MIPEIRNDNGIETLYVHDKPFLALSGEIHNSSASNLDFMEKNVWNNLKDLNMNSVIVPIYWEQIEKEEGKYDFSLVEGLIHQARENSMKLAIAPRNTLNTVIISWLFLHIFFRDCTTGFFSPTAFGASTTTVSLHLHAQSQKQGSIATEQITVVQK